MPTASTVIAISLGLVGLTQALGCSSSDVAHSSEKANGRTNAGAGGDSSSGSGGQSSTGPSTNQPATCAVGFDPIRRFATVARSALITSADLNNDEARDLVVVTSSDGDVENYISVLLNEGDSNFAPFKSYRIGYHGRPSGVIAGDFDQNGWQDVAVSDVFDGVVAVFFNEGNGSFDEVVTFSVGDEPTSLIGADFNGDGLLDIATSNFTGNFASFLMNSGNRQFAPKVDYQNSGPRAAVLGSGIAAADLDGDGDQDLAVADDAGDALQVIMNQGDGTFGKPTSYPAGDTPVGVAVGDLNADGKPDIALVNRHDTKVSLFMNQGQGLFGAEVALATVTDCYYIATADFNGDGLSDLALTDWRSTSLRVFINLGAGRFAEPMLLVKASTDQFKGITVGDFNGDGRTDVALADDSSEATSSLGAGIYLTKCQ